MVSITYELSYNVDGECLSAPEGLNHTEHVLEPRRVEPLSQKWVELTNHLGNRDGFRLTDPL